MHVRIQPEPGGHNPGADVGAIIDMNAPVGAKLAALASRIEMEARYALRRKRIAEYRVQQSHVQFAGGRCFPMGMAEVNKLPGKLNSVLFAGAFFVVRKP